MRYLSVCSGIEAATVAWHPLGWTPAAFSEIEPFPRAVLTHHYPEVPCHGDFTTIEADQYGPIDLLVGGTPCQDFSVAGLRAGLSGERGNLSLEYLRLAQRKRPQWLVWENVPGVLSQDGGRAFGAILGGMVELGYGVAYRVLDAQFVRVDGFERAVPQRRRRVFVVGYLGDWRRAAAVLFERQGLSGHPAPRRKAGESTSHPVAQSLVSSGRGVERAGETRGQDAVVAVAFGGNRQSGALDVATAVNAHGGPHGRLDFESETFVYAPPLTGNPYGDHESREGLLVAHSITASRSSTQCPNEDTTLVSQSGVRTGDAHATLDSNNGSKRHNGVIAGSAVRRLMPVECEKLQGFWPGYTDVPYRGKPASDGPRYKALGNSMAVNCMRWIGQRIQQVEALSRFSEAAE